MDHSESWISALAIVCLFGLPVCGFIAVRAFRFIERMEMIKRGIVPPPEGMFRGRAWREYMRQNPGQAAQMPGAWQQAPQPPPQQQQQSRRAANCDDDSPQLSLYKGIRLALIGFAILIGLSFIGGTPLGPDFHGGPWLLGGLIPMFVGIAQILIAVLSGAQFPGVQPQTTFIPPPQPGQYQPPPPPGYAGPVTPPPWTDQPGRPRFEELSKPVPPPDLR